MAWVNTQEKWSGRVADSTQEDGNGLTIETRRRIYTVLYDAITDGPAAAIYATGIPLNGDTDADLPQCTVYKKSVVTLNPFLFEVTVDYAGRDSILLAPYERGWESQVRVEDAQVDGAGAAILTPTKERIQVVAERADYVYVVTRNETTFPSETAREYQNAVSNDAYQDFSAGEGKMVGGITGRRIVEGTSYYWKVTYRIQFRNGGWLVKTPIFGMKRLVAGLTVETHDEAIVVPPVAGEPVKITTPIRLSAAGAELAVSAATEYLSTQMLTPLSFVALGLG